jgi:NSS family neurotransmitter:Na+ symporter
MADTHTSGSGQRWSNRWLFVLAAAGSAVGLGNIWKFPYIAGENGGGAFVLIYLVCIAAVGIPIMVSEVLMGRQGRSSPIHTMRKLAKQSGRSSRWSILGWMGVLAGFLILSYYAVIAGWAVNYIWASGSGTFTGASAEAVGQSFNEFLASPMELIAYQTGFFGPNYLDRWPGCDQGLGGCHSLVYAPAVCPAHCLVGLCL